MMRGNTKLGPWWCRAVGRRRSESRSPLVSLPGSADTRYVSSISWSSELCQGREQIKEKSGCSNSGVSVSDVGNSKLSKTDKYGQKRPILKGIVLPRFRPFNGLDAVRKSFVNNYSISVPSESVGEREGEPVITRFSDLLPNDVLENEIRPFINDFTTIMPDEVFETGTSRKHRQIPKAGSTAVLPEVSEAAASTPFVDDSPTSIASNDTVPSFGADAGERKPYSSVFSSSGPSIAAEAGEQKFDVSDLSSEMPSYGADAGKYKPYVSDLSRTLPSSGERKPYVSDFAGTMPSSGERKPYVSDFSSTMPSSGERKPYVSDFASTMPSSGERKPYVSDFSSTVPSSGERKSYVSDYSSTMPSSGERKPYVSDFSSRMPSSGERKPPYASDLSSTLPSSGEQKPYMSDFSNAMPSSGERKPYVSDFSSTFPSSAERKPYVSDFSTSKTSFASKNGDTKPFFSDFSSSKISVTGDSSTFTSTSLHSRTTIPSASMNASTNLPSGASEDLGRKPFLNDFSSNFSPSSRANSSPVADKGTYYPAYQPPVTTPARQKDDRFFRSRNNSTVANMLKLLEAAPSELDVAKILEERIPTAEESRFWPWLPLLDALQKGPKPYLALEVFYWKKSKFDGGDPREYAKMISTAGKLNQLDLARTIFKEMEEKGLKRTPITCNALISAYSKNDQSDKALAIFEEMQEAEDCKPTIVTFNTIISMYSKLSVPQMEKYFNLCKSSGFFPDRVTYNSMIWGYMRGNEFEKMESTYEQLKSSGCKPDPITFSALIIGFSKANEVNKMESAFSHMQEEGIPISTMIAEILTEYYALDKKFEKMERIMKIVANTPGTACSSRIYGFAIQSYAETGRIQDMEETMKMMFASNRLFTSAKTLESVITAYGSRYNFEGLEQILDKIKGMGWAFQQSTFHTLLYEYGKGKEFEKMEKVFKDMEAALDLEPTSETFKILADSYRSAGDGEGLKKTIDRMSAAGLPTKEVAHTEVDRVWTDDEIFGGKPR